MKTVSIPRHVLRAMEHHAQEGSPFEVCGILAGTDFPICRIIPMTNTERSPVSYFMDPAEQFRIFRELRERSETMLAIYHSHPAAEAFPSAKDVSLAFYDDVLYLIISLLGGGPVIRAFSIVNGLIEERTIEPL